MPAFMVLMLMLMASLLLQGCSSIKFNTNVFDVGEQNIRANDVDVYSQQYIFNRQYKDLGNVDASYCQQDRPTDLNKTAPSDESLIKSLKAQVQRRGANALVVHECKRSSYGQCSLLIECRGTGYLID
ncbi:hypothetical protein ACRWQL_12975 [Shewanella sp. HL-SH4]|uniref:hypothetical protein n=1 Tax=Shewanella sp. HL-SH4 TaxID=3436240 RepID=UPI003EC069DF